VCVLKTSKNIQHITSQTDHQKISLIITSNKMVQTENAESKMISNDNSMEIRTTDECLTIYKTQVK